MTVDAEGRIDYINHSAEVLLGQQVNQVLGKTLAEVASLVDENDRRDLGDRAQQALHSAGRASAARRAVLLPANGSNERFVEISVTPLQLDATDSSGLVLVLH